MPAAPLSRRAFLGALPRHGAGLSFTDACLSARGITCRSCAETCGERAIRLRPRLGGRAEPEVESDVCTLCGDCAAVCPADAIVLIRHD